MSGLRFGAGQGTRLRSPIIGQATTLRTSRCGVAIAHAAPPSTWHLGWPLDRSDRPRLLRSRGPGCGAASSYPARGARRRTPAARRAGAGCRQASRCAAGSRRAPRRPRRAGSRARRCAGCPGRTRAGTSPRQGPRARGRARHRRRLSFYALRTLPLFVVEAGRASGLAVTAVLAVLVLRARLSRVEIGALAGLSFAILALGARVLRGYAPQVLLADPASAPIST